MERESMKYDVIIVGAGPAGLSCAIRFAQLCRENNKNYTLAVLEKGADVGAHILSGAVLDPKALNELIPDWASQNAPIRTQVTSDAFYLLTKNKSFRMPTPSPMKNHGNYIISLGELCQWLATQAQNLNVEIFSGFAAQKCLFDNNNQVVGIHTGDMGIDKNLHPKSNYQPGVDVFAQYTLLAEGCRGHLSQEIIARYELNKQTQPQTYGLGFKELWEIEPQQHQLGSVTHTLGWPLDSKTYGGSFIYHLEDCLLSIGFVIGLDYQNPYLKPYEEFQRFKQHPLVAPLLEKGRCLKYGARALNEGGWQSLPQLHFKGGLLLGCAAGFLHVAKIKGIHTAMKSGMLAAESIFEALNKKQSKISEVYTDKINHSWIKTELFSTRNIRPSFQWGLWPGLIYSAIDYYCLKGKAPWTFTHKQDYGSTKQANACKMILYPKPDGIISFDKMTSVSRSQVSHEENQPCHLELKHHNYAVTINYEKYAGLEANYCPAGVYEYLTDENGTVRLQINAQNCIHCKTCDIKDPTQNIKWVPPEGGGGPNYSNM